MTDRHTYPAWLAVLGAIMLMSAPMTGAARETAKWCEEAWTAESAKAVHGSGEPDFEGLLARWLQYRNRCEGTVVYESRLAIAFIMVGRLDEAEKVLSPLRGVASEYAYLVDLVDAQFSYYQHMQGKPRESLDSLENRFVAYVQKYPQIPEGHAQLGAIRTIRGKHAEAIDSLKAALQSKMDLSGVYRNLTVSYEALGRYQDAREAADQAVTLRLSLVLDPPFIYAASRANAATGWIELAMKALNTLGSSRRELEKDPEFWKAIQFVKDKRAPER